MRASSHPIILPHHLGFNPPSRLAGARCKAQQPPSLSPLCAFLNTAGSLQHRHLATPSGMQFTVSTCSGAVQGAAAPVIFADRCLLRAAPARSIACRSATGSGCGLGFPISRMTSAKRLRTRGRDGVSVHAAAQREAQFGSGVPARSPVALQATVLQPMNLHYFNDRQRRRGGRAHLTHHLRRGCTAHNLLHSMMWQAELVICSGQWPHCCCIEAAAQRCLGCIEG